ncbi:MAG: phosphoribosyltransferase domain-containing protein [Muribaculaceae bacterium]|nr:phosphoribosyltransferase domain-containing protein [Muribaculaceae bacterium]
MQVLTLDPTSFDEHSARLAQIIGNSWHIDALVGVRRGGSFVCDALCKHLREEQYGARYDVELQRPSTKHKNGTLSRILKMFPRPMLDVMRMAESTLLSFRRTLKSQATMSTKVEIPEGLASILKTIECPNILLIDDAIDSGDTLFAISETLRNINPKITIRIAVITVTTQNPRIDADFAIYKNKTLIRFPWSNDYKNR